MPAYPVDPMWSYPASRSLTFRTQIGTGQDRTEQRWPLTLGEERWVLSYPNLTLTQRNTLLAFFDTVKGSYAQDITLTFNGTAYTGCNLDMDALRFTESRKTRHAASVSILKPVRTVDAGALPASFPVLTSGARMQLPYSHEHNFETISVQTEGARYSYSTKATPLRVWSVGGSALTDTDALAIYDMFRLARGRWREFQFTDPDDGVTHTHCRFASDSLEWRYVNKGINAIEAFVQQVS